VPAEQSPSFQPLYLQIKQLVMQSLDAGEWHPGEAIPSEMDLAQRYKVSQGTVRKAIDELAAENLLVRRQGKGTFVATHTEPRTQFRFLRLTPNEGEPRYPESTILECKRGRAPAEIARALEPYNVLWLEEIMPPDNIESYARLKVETSVPLCVSERLFTRFGFRQVVEQRAADIIMPDMAWTGGISETRKICSLADTYYLPITSHDTIGPVALWSAAHLMLHIPNAMIMETVRAYTEGWYNDVMTERIPISEGMLSLPERPGLGTALREEVLSRPDVHIEVSDEQHRHDGSKG
jgi:DNA-binding transcriptional regulator YhcF (GntR family)